jgi:hypothetical protein
LLHKIEDLYIYLLLTKLPVLNNHLEKWKSLLLFCAGLAAGSAFCMKWMEPDLWAGNEQFTIMGLEIFYSHEKVAAVMKGMDESTRRILEYHLHFDFAFMAGIFPGIASLCMIAASRLSRFLLKRLLVILAALQTLAWGLDIIENMQLISWIRGKPLGNEFVSFQYVVIVKWVIALVGAITAIAVLLFTWKKLKKAR